MHKNRDELKDLGPSGLLNYVRDSYELWKRTAVDKGLLKETIAYFENQNEEIHSNWLGREGDAAYRQTYDKFQKYIEILKAINSGQPVDHSSVRHAMIEVENMATGLYKNWEESPKDQCIPPVLKNYLYMRHVFEKSAGF